MDRPKSEDLVRILSESLTSGSVAAIGAALGSPAAVAAALGAPAGERILRWWFEAARGRGNRRENVRAAEIVVLVLRETGVRLEKGDEPRSDSPWIVSNGRGGGEEVLEGVTRAAIASYEERKLPYLARFFASVQAEPGIDVAYAHRMLQALDRLSYTGIAVMATIFQEGLGSGSVPSRTSAEDVIDSKAAFAAELDELGRLGIVGVGQPGGRVVPSEGVWDGGSASSVDVGALTLTPLGRDLYRLGHIVDVDPAERKWVRDSAETLRWSIDRD